MVRERRCGLRADLRARQTHTSVTIPAPAEGRAKARINWLLRQLTDAPDEIRIEVAYPWHARRRARYSDKLARGSIA